MSREDFLELEFGVSDEPLTVEEFNRRQSYNLEHGSGLINK